jgi:hypothetical protein
MVPTEETLKRTRRVEVTRYSRRSMLISNDVALEPDLTAEQAAIDVLLGIPCPIESPVEEISGAEPQPAEAGDLGAIQKRRPLKLLKNWIRRRTP